MIPATKQRGANIQECHEHAAAGVDVIQVAGGAGKIEHMQAIHAATKLPLISPSGAGKLTREELAGCGVRIMLEGHLPVAAAVKALHETYTHLFNGGAPADLKNKIASVREMERLVSNEHYRRWLDQYNSERVNFTNVDRRAAVSGLGQA